MKHSLKRKAIDVNAALRFLLVHEGLLCVPSQLVSVLHVSDVSAVGEVRQRGLQLPGLPVAAMHSLGSLLCDVWEPQLIHSAQ